jgi:hypothetical protein
MLILVNHKVNQPYKQQNILSKHTKGNAISRIFLKFYYGKETIK